MKNKPVSHIKKGDTLVFLAEDGRRFQNQVSKVEVYDLDENKIKLTFPAIFEKTAEGKRVERAPKSTLVLHKNEQVFYI